MPSGTLASAAAHPPEADPVEDGDALVVVLDLGNVAEEFLVRLARAAREDETLLRFLDLTGGDPSTVTRSLRALTKGRAVRDALRLTFTQGAALDLADRLEWSATITLGDLRFAQEQDRALDEDRAARYDVEAGL